MREQKVGSVEVPSHHGNLCSLGRVAAPSSALYLVCFWKWENIGSEKKKITWLCVFMGIKPLQKEKILVPCNVFLMLVKGTKNRLWRFSHLVHRHPIGSAFPGSCQTRNFGMSFCRYFSRRSEFGLQLNYKVKPSLWCAEMFLDFPVPLMIHCQALKLNEL